MPKVNDGESKEDFAKRCIPIIMKEGIQGKGVAQDQAIAVCYSMHRQHMEEKSGAKKFDDYNETRKRGPEE